jgi:hypothetical protein
MYLSFTNQTGVPVTFLACSGEMRSSTLSKDTYEPVGNIVTRSTPFLQIPGYFTLTV